MNIFLLVSNRLMGEVKVVMECRLALGRGFGSGPPGVLTGRALNNEG